MKGQSSMEFLAFVSLAALILAGMYGVMSSKQKKAFERNEKITAQKIAEKASFQVEMALVQGDGYSRVFNLPAEISGSHYNLTVVNETVLVEWRDHDILRSSLYSGDRINISTRKTNVFKVLNNESDIRVEEVT